MTLWRISLRNLMRKKLRSFLTALAILIGVAATVTAVSMVGTTQNMIQHYSEHMTGQADAYIYSQDGLMNTDLVHRINGIEGISEAVAVSEKSALITGLPAKNSLSAEFENYQLRLDLTTVTHLPDSMFKMTAEDGSIHDQGLIIDAETAAIWEVEAGDEAALTIDDQKIALPVAAVVSSTVHLSGPDSWEAAAGTRWQAFVTFETLEQHGGPVLNVQQTQVQFEENSTLTSRLLDDELAAIDDGLVSQTAVTDESQMASGMDELYAALYVGGGLSLLISAFILYNTLYISILERQKEFAIMKAVGYTPGQVRNGIIREVFMLAFAGTAAGLVAGVFMSMGFTSLMMNVFQDTLVYDMQWGAALAIGSIAGIIIPLIAAWRPVSKAARTSVTYVFRHAGEGETGLKWGAFRAVIGAGLLIPGLFVNHMAAFLPLFLGIAVLFPFLFHIIKAVLAPVNSWLFGQPGKMAARNLGRQGSRTALTSAILSFGITLLVFMSSMNLAINASMEKLIGHSSGGDVWLIYNEPLTEEQTDNLMEVEGVQDMTHLSSSQIIWHQNDQLRSFSATGINSTSIDKFPLFQYDQSNSSELFGQVENERAVILGTELYHQWGGRIGETITLESASGIQEWQVAGVVDTARQGGYIAFMHDAVLEEEFAAYERHDLFVLTDNTPAADVKQDIMDEYPDSVTLAATVDEQIAEYQRQTNDIFFMINAIVIIGIAVASIGMMNTMLMNMIERVKEIGTMRALGTTRKQVMNMMLSEALFMGTAAAIAGGGAGLLVMYVTSAQNYEALDIPFMISWQAVGSGFVLALIVSAGACFLPAKRAANVNMSLALKSD